MQELTNRTRNGRDEPNSSMVGGVVVILLALALIIRIPVGKEKPNDTIPGKLLLK